MCRVQTRMNDYRDPRSCRSNEPCVNVTFFSRDTARRTCNVTNNDRNHTRPVQAHRANCRLVGARRPAATYREQRKAKLDGATALRSLCRECARARRWRHYRPIFVLHRRYTFESYQHDRGQFSSVHIRKHSTYYHNRISWRCLHVYAISPSSVGQVWSWSWLRCRGRSRRVS